MWQAVLVLLIVAVALVIYVAVGVCAKPEEEPVNVTAKDLDELIRLLDALGRDVRNIH